MNVIQRKTIANVNQLYKILLENALIKEVLLGSSVKTILDVGVGSGVSAKTLQQISKKKVVGLDINNDLWEGYKNIPITIYNGRTIPFKNSRFDLTLLFLVLHHCEDQKKVISEVARTTKKHVLILEEIKINRFNSVCMMVYDWLVNLLIFNHSIRLASFKTEQELEHLFESVGLVIKTKQLHEKNFFVQRVCYLLEKK